MAAHAQQQHPQLPGDQVALVAHLDRLRDAAAALKAQLPWNCATADDARAFLVWTQADTRYLETFCREAVMTIIPGLEELDTRPKRAEKLTNARKGAADKRGIRELGRALKDLDEFCLQHVIPLVARLEKGMTMLEALPLSQEGDARHTTYVVAWMKLRKEVKDTLPAAWHIAVAARALYEALPDEQQQEAIGIWGPLRAKDKQDHGPLLRRSFPAEQLEELDRRAQRQGIVDLNNPFPNGKHERRKQ